MTSITFKNSNELRARRLGISNRVLKDGVARQMFSALRGSGTDSVRGRKARSLMADMEKVTNILLNAERWSLR